MMTLTEMAEAFSASSDEEFLHDERIANPRHARRDLAAFLLLAELVRGDDPMISTAAHDEYFLSIDCEELAKVITVDQVVELVRCGIRYDAQYDCLAVFA